MSKDGTQGWAVGSSGMVLRFERGAWRRDVVASSVTNQPLLALALSRDGTRGWAVGGDVVLRFEHGKWQRDVVSGETDPSLFLSALWLSDDGTEGWAAGENGMVLRLEQGK
jgi:photosystem II stability/assembly factor-like uncharacterized protein